MFDEVTTEDTVTQKSDQKVTLELNHARSQNRMKYPREEQAHKASLSQRFWHCHCQN